MSGVKQSPYRLLKIAGPFGVGAALLALTACESSDLARFAPPGIVKYEEIAGDKPQNPDVAARIAERRGEAGTGDFPRLSETPGKDQRPKKRKAADIEAEMSDLTGARETLSAQVAADWAAAEAELEEDLPAAREALKEQVENDSKAAARERGERLSAPPDEK